MKKGSPYRRLLMLVAMALAMLTVELFGAGKAFACSSTCGGHAYLEYDYSANGMAAQVLDEPISSSACSGSNNCTFQAYIYMENSSGYLALIGVESDYGNAVGNACGAGSTGYNEYVYYWDYYHPYVCKKIPTSDRGFIINIQFNDYSSNGGGIQFYANDGGSNTFCTGFTCYYPGEKFTGSFERYASNFDVSGSFSSNKLTSATVTSLGNMYQQTNGTWTYLTTTEQHLVYGNPPWIGWKAGQSPMPGNTGGEWYTCAANKGSNPC